MKRPMNWLVTGATGDLGMAIVKRLKRAKQWEGVDHNVLATGRDPGRLQKVEALGAKVVAFEALPDLLQVHTPIDRVIHCIGKAEFRGQFLEHMAVNAGTAIKVLELVRKHGAEDCSVVLIGSVSAWSASPGLISYGASKAALRGIVRTAAKEMAPKRVNLVEPGAIEGDMNEYLLKYLTPTQRGEFRRKHALGFSRPEQVARAVIEISGFEVMTGAVVPLDGGYAL